MTFLLDPYKFAAPVTYVIRAETSDARIYSANATYSTARAGSGLTVDAVSDTTSGLVGQQLSGGTYYCIEGFEAFDTSVIPDGATVLSALLSLTPSGDFSATDFTVEARLHDWGATVDTSDWVAGADLGTKTLLASISSADYNAGGMDLASEAAFAANINKTGMTRILLCSSRHRGNNTPVGDEFLSFCMADHATAASRPTLTVVAVG